MGGNAVAAAPRPVEQDLLTAQTLRRLGIVHPGNSFSTSTACTEASQITQPPFCFHYPKHHHPPKSFSTS